MRFPDLSRPGALIGFLADRRTLIEWIALFAFSIGLAVLLVASRGAERADNLIHDAFARAFPASVDPGILIVGIDNDSLARIGAWPWPRSVHAAAIERIGAAKPRAIVYDVLLLEPSARAEEDAALTPAIAGAGPVFFPLLIQGPGSSGAAADITLPIEPVARAMAGTGQVIAPLDDDGILRRTRLSAMIAGQCRPHLIETVQARLTGGTADCRAASDGLIPYAGPAGRYTTISFAAIAAGEVPPELLRDRIVMVGATASGLGDQYATPMRNRADLMSGVEVQANLLAALRGPGLRHEAGIAGRIAFTLVPLVALWIGFLFLAPRGILLLAAALTLMVVAASAWLFAARGIWAGPVPALIAIAAILPLWGWRRLAAASRYIVDELDRLRSEPGVLPPAAAPRHTDRLQLQMALLSGAIGQVRTLKHFIEALQASLPDAILVAQPDGTIAIANERAHALCERRLGRRAEGGLALLARAFRRHIRDREDFDALAAALRGPAPAERECEVTLNDGEAFLLRAKPLFDADGNCFLIVRLTDISTLRAAARQRETMLEFLTHDMRSPQVSILALLARTGDGELPGPVAARIEGHARQTLDLAEQFVQIARAEAAAYDVGEADLNDVAIEAADQLWSQAEARGIAIEVTPHDEELLVLGSPELLVRAIANLVGNAVKYCAPGNRVSVRTDTDEAGAICVVEDDGPGMEPDQVARIFESFTRFRPQAADPADMGVGLGLAFVRIVVTRHGGTIECRSAPGEGARFTIRLPRAAQEPAPISG